MQSCVLVLIPFCIIMNFDLNFRFDHLQLKVEGVEGFVCATIL